MQHTTCDSHLGKKKKKKKFHPTNSSSKQMWQHISNAVSPFLRVSTQVREECSPVAASAWVWEELLMRHTHRHRGKPWSNLIWHKLCQNPFIMYNTLFGTVYINGTFLRGGASFSQTLFICDAVVCRLVVWLLNILQTRNQQLITQFTPKAGNTLKRIWVKQVSGPSSDRFWCCWIWMMIDTSLKKKKNRWRRNYRAFCRGIKQILHLPQTLYK